MFGLIAKVGAVVASKAVAFVAPVLSKCVAAGAALLAPVAEATGAGTIDTAVIQDLLDLCKQVMTLFTEFPLNVFLIASFVGIGFGIFKAAKRAARH